MNIYTLIIVSKYFQVIKFTLSLKRRLVYSAQKCKYIK